MSDDVPQISVRVSETSTIRLRLVERYVHLGNVVTHSASSLEDIQAKSASAMPVLRRLQQTLLRNTELRPDEKVLLTASLVLAKIEFGAGLWCPRTSCERDSAHTALARPWRAVCRRICGHSTKFLDDSEIFSILGVPSAQETLHASRVRHLLCVLREGPGFLWHCIQATKDWLALAWDASVQVLKAAEDAAVFELQGGCPSICVLHRHQVAIRRALRGYRKFCMRQREASKQAAVAKAQAIAVCEAKGGAVFTVPNSPCGQFVCELCPMRFASKANKAAHQSTVHKVSAAVASASGTTCNVCRVEWWTTHRLKEHLRRSPVCRDTYHNADLPTAGKHEAIGSKKDRAFRPPVEVQGPLPWWATLRPPPLGAEIPQAQREEAQQDAQDKLGRLADEFGRTSFCEWAPKAFAWLRCYRLEALHLQDSHPSFCAFQILAGVAEHIGEGGLIARYGYRAIKRGNLWWVEPT